MQAAHSFEEYVGRLYESFPLARFISGLFSDDLDRGFLMMNVVLVSAGIWCALVPVLRGWRLARPIVIIWTIGELVNGIGHPLWSIARGAYTPGVATAPILFVLAWLLALELRRPAEP
jgi:hypothetical protein